MKNTATANAAPQRPECKPGGRRSGVILLYGLVCLALLSTSLVAAVQLSLMAAHFRMSDETAAQADWLADAGLVIAVEKLRLDPAYTGETWELSETDAPLNRPARVLIRLERAEAADALDSSTQPGDRILRVEASYPADAVRKVTAVRSVTLPGPAEPAPEE